MFYKKFDKASYEIYDQSAKQAFISYYFDNFGIEITENPDQYGIDLIGKKIEGKNFYFEIQVAAQWGKGKFPFKWIKIPARKKKFCGMKNTYIVTFSADLSQMMFTSGSYLTPEYLINTPNCYSDDEYSYAIPPSCCVAVRV